MNVSPYLDSALVSDGSPDCPLVPCINWIIHQAQAVRAADGKWAALRSMPNETARFSLRSGTASGQRSSTTRTILEIER